MPRNARTSSIMSLHAKHCPTMLDTKHASVDIREGPELPHAAHDKNRPPSEGHFKKTPRPVLHLQKKVATPVAPSVEAPWQPQSCCDFRAMGVLQVENLLVHAVVFRRGKRSVFCTAPVVSRHFWWKRARRNSFIAIPAPASPLRAKLGSSVPSARYRHHHPVLTSAHYTFWVHCCNYSHGCSNKVNHSRLDVFHFFLFRLGQ